MRFTGKTVLVTGASRGIGHAVAERLLAEGATVLAAQRLPVDLPAAVHLPLDLHAIDTRSLAAALDRHGGVDVLVNNAGVMHQARVDQTSASQWHETLAVNLTAPFLLTGLVVPWMRRRGGGAIVNVGSIEGLGANPQHAAYCASKAGLHGLTRASAVDLGEFGIRCNAVAPGWIDTGLNEDYIAAMPDPAAFRDAIGRIHPLGRTGTPHEVAALIAWLASDEAAFVTGQIYTIDGGRTARLSLP